MDWFSKYYDVVMGPLEKRKFQGIRKNLLAKAKGKVLEIGSGTGVNFPLYEAADEVVAIEPNPSMREQSLRRARQARLPIHIMNAEAEELPFPDHAFDTVVATLVFCTIPDPWKALDEIRRVCKSGGTVLLFEHVRINDTILGSFQDWLTPMWKHLCDGCHLNRDTLELVRRAGFQINRVEGFYKDIFIVVEAVNRK